MAATRGFAGTALGTVGQVRGRTSQQQDFLDYMQHHRPGAWHRFMDEYRGYNFDRMSMYELEGRFNAISKQLPRRDEFRMVYEELCQPPPTPKKLTWFEEIQAEVNEWLKEVS